MDTTNDEPVSLLTAKNVASILKISKSMAYRLIQRGDIASVQICNSVRVRHKDLETYIQKNWSGWSDSAEDFKQF